MGQLTTTAPQHAGPRLEFRPVADEEMAFVRSSWSKSSRPRCVLKRVWKQSQRVVMEALLASGRVIVACSPTVREEVLGWVSIDDAHGLVNYIYVKEHMRRFGIARSLLRDAGAAIRPTHLMARATFATSAGHTLINQHEWLVYDPFGFAEVLRCSKS